MTVGTAGPRRPSIGCCASARELHQLAPRQLVTVGVARAASLWQADPQGRTLLDVLRLRRASTATTPGPSARRSPGSARIRRSPWCWRKPAGPPARAAPNPTFSETHQVVLYRAMLRRRRARDLDGLLAWMLWDFPPTTSAGAGVESEQDHFGLLRLDGSLKPGAVLFRDGFRAEVRAAGQPPTAGPAADHRAHARPRRSTRPTGSRRWSSRRPGTTSGTSSATTGGASAGWTIFGYPITRRAWRTGARSSISSGRASSAPRKRTAARLRQPGKAGQLRLVVQLTRLGAPLAEAQHFRRPAAARRRRRALVPRNAAHACGARSGSSGSTTPA